MEKLWFKNRATIRRESSNNRGEEPFSPAAPHPQGDEWAKHLSRAVALCEHVGDRAGTAEALLETALGERGGESDWR